MGRDENLLINFTWPGFMLIKVNFLVLSSSIISFDDASIITSFYCHTNKIRHCLHRFFVLALKNCKKKKRTSFFEAVNYLPSLIGFHEKIRGQEVIFLMALLHWSAVIYIWIWIQFSLTKMSLSSWVFIEPFHYYCIKFPKKQLISSSE